jgi:hypothetical protein
MTVNGKFDPKMLEHLCPEKCRGDDPMMPRRKVDQQGGASGLSDQGGIPVLLIDEARVIDKDWYVPIRRASSW